MSYYCIIFLAFNADMNTNIHLTSKLAPSLFQFSPSHFFFYFYFFIVNVHLYFTFLHYWCIVRQGFFLWLHKSMFFFVSVCVGEGGGGIDVMTCNQWCDVSFNLNSAGVLEISLSRFLTWLNCFKLMLAWVDYEAYFVA